MINLNTVFIDELEDVSDMQKFLKDEFNIDITLFNESENIITIDLFDCEYKINIDTDLRAIHTEGAFEMIEFISLFWKWLNEQ